MVAVVGHVVQEQPLTVPGVGLVAHNTSKMQIVCACPSEIGSRRLRCPKTAANNER